MSSVEFEPFNAGLIPLEHTCLFLGQKVKTQLISAAKRKHCLWPILPYFNIAEENGFYRGLVKHRSN